MSGALEFYDTNTLLSLHQDQHQACTDVQWDPTGRYVTTYVSHWRNKSENGYKVWTFYGKELSVVNKDPFFQFLWRPRPKSLLSKERLEELSKPSKFKEFEAKYKAADKVRVAQTNEKLHQEFEKRRQEYKEQQRRRMEQWRNDTAWRKSIGVPDEKEEDFIVVEECVEEILEERIEVLDD